MTSADEAMNEIIEMYPIGSTFRGFEFEGKVTGHYEETYGIPLPYTDHVSYFANALVEVTSEDGEVKQFPVDRLPVREEAMNASNLAMRP